MHVADASRAAGVISKLLSDDGEQRDEFLAGLDAEYRRVIEAHERAEVERNRMTIEDGARQRRRARPSTRRRCSHRSFTGVRAFDALDVGEIAPYIDWTPFFHVWGLRGRYPAILEDDVLGDAARPLFDDAQRMLDRIVAEQWFAAEGGGRVLAGPPRRRRHRACLERSAGLRYDACTGCASSSAGRASPTCRSPTSWRRRRRACATTSARSS